MPWWLGQRASRGKGWLVADAVGLLAVRWGSERESIRSLTVRPGILVLPGVKGVISVYSSPSVCIPRPNVKMRYAARTARSIMD